jgi:hypothetical protein
MNLVTKGKKGAHPNYISEILVVNNGKKTNRKALEKKKVRDNTAR